MHFKGCMHVERVRAWRAAHPDHRPSMPRPVTALQGTLMTQVTDFDQQIGDLLQASESPVEHALQVLLNISPALMAGLITQLFEVSLQDDMATTTRRLVQRGQDRDPRWWVRRRLSSACCGPSGWVSYPGSSVGLTRRWRSGCSSARRCWVLAHARLIELDLIAYPAPRTYSSCTDQTVRLHPSLLT